MKSFVTLIIVFYLMCDKDLMAQQSGVHNIAPEKDGLAPVPFFLTSNDGGISSINSIPDFQCDYSIMPAVIIENFGSADMTSATLEYFIDNNIPDTLNWTGVLPPFDTAAITLPLISVAPGSHTLFINVTEANGQVDLNGDNDGSIAFNVVGTGEPAPYFETFQQQVLPLGYFIDNHNEGPTWSVVTINNPYSPLSCVRMPFYSNDVKGDVDDLYVKNIDLTNVGQAQLSFNLAYACYSDYYWDELKVMISTDCGSNWTAVYDKEKNDLATAPATDVSFVPEASQWRSEVIDISSYAGNASVMIRFEAVSGHGNNLYVDNIDINDNVGIPQVYDGSTKLNLFPNPAADAVSLSSSVLGLPVCRVAIYNSLGQKVYTSDLSNLSHATIPVSQLAPGSYRVVVNADGIELSHAPLIVAR